MRFSGQAQHLGQIWKCDFSTDGSLCITAGFDGTARVWTVDTNKLMENAKARLTRKFARKFTRKELEPYRVLLGSRIEELVRDQSMPKIQLDAARVSRTRSEAEQLLRAGVQLW